MASNNTNLTTVIQGFEFTCRTEGKSPRTVEWYVSFLNRFHKFILENELPTDVGDIGTFEVRKFIHFLQTKARPWQDHPYIVTKDRKLSPASVQGYVRTLKAFFKWLVNEGIIENNVMAKIPIPKAPQKVIETFSQEQISQLLDAVQKVSDTCTRDLAIILLFLDSGIRVSELVSLTLSDLRLNQGLIKIVSGKGGKERLVPIGSNVQRILWRYVHYFRPRPIVSSRDILFLSKDGRSSSKNGIERMMRRYGNRAGIENVRCSPHTLRHTFAKNFLLNGGDIFSLQRILGHSSLEAVRIYLNLASSDLQAQHRKSSPVDNLTIRIPGTNRTLGKVANPTTTDIQHTTQIAGGE